MFATSSLFKNTMGRREGREPKGAVSLCCLFAAVGVECPCVPVSLSQCGHRRSTLWNTLWNTASCACPRALGSASASPSWWSPWVSERQPGQGRGLRGGYLQCRDLHTISGNSSEADSAHFPRRRASVCSLRAFSRSQLFRRSCLKWCSLVQ